ncbi:shikimate dehydrogenase [Legionella sp. CNM-4043-24]|uniref:shikimate dehydrogenase n=1 Tax=Legionella sp. CNM-4043-24 TaxID=3421646 RepID=UPI00403AFC73
MSGVIRCAVIGRPISHSLSPAIHQQFAGQFGMELVYERIEGHEQGFEQQVRDFFAAGGKGLNITLPFKERAFAMAGLQTPRCRKARAANTLWMENGRLHADNTDGAGLVNDLSRYVALQGRHLLVLGAGGAARGIIGPLLEAGISRLSLTNRDPVKAQALQQDFPVIHLAAFAKPEPADLIINATSAGVTGQALQLPEHLWASRPFCYDLSYSKTGSTPFVDSAKRHGCQAMDGLGMLIEQAAAAFYIWHGKKPDTDLARERLT